LILLALLPVAVYLLVLGGINRRRHPLMVSGVWDFIGLLFAASGFLFFGGPALLNSVNERLRGYYVLIVVVGSILYFLIVVVGSGFLLWRQRSLTSIYNVDPAVVQRCLLQIFERLRLNPVRSGNLYLFGLAGEPSPPVETAHESIRGPHYLPGAITTRIDSGSRPPGEGEFLGQTAILEVDSFASLRHVTLRWDPVDTLFRQEIEAQLQQLLSRIPTEESDVGAWMTVIGLGIMIVVLLAGIALVLLQAWSIWWG